MLGLSSGPRSLVYRLTPSASELRSVSTVYGCDSRFERLSVSCGGGEIEIGWRVECRGESAGDEREIERSDAVSASSSSGSRRKLRGAAGDGCGKKDMV